MLSTTPILWVSQTSYSARFTVSVNYMRTALQKQTKMFLQLEPALPESAGLELQDLAHSRCWRWERGPRSRGHSCPRPCHQRTALRAGARAYLRCARADAEYAPAATKAITGNGGAGPGLIVGSSPLRPPTFSPTLS